MKKSLKQALLLAFATVGCSTSFAGSWGEPLDQPKAVLKMVEALESSGRGQLNSYKTKVERKAYSWHLRSISYLGTVERGKEKFFIAATHYIRSSFGGQQTPPARGHSYIVIFRSDFTIAASAEEDVSDCGMEGNKLYRDGKVVIDFDNRSLFLRRYGYMLEGGHSLPYFFSDRITDKQWNDEEFLKRNPEVAEFRKQQIEAEKREAEAEEARKRKVEEEAQKR